MLIQSSGNIHDRKFLNHTTDKCSRLWVLRQLAAELGIVTISQLVQITLVSLAKDNHQAALPGVAPNE